MYMIIFETSTSWSQPNRCDTIYNHHYRINFLWWSWEWIRQISFEKWKKINKKM